MTTPRNSAARESRSVPRAGVRFDLRYPLGILVLASLTALYWFSGFEMYKAWVIVDSYYSHGFLIPFISLFFVWKQRAGLMRSDDEPAGWGYALIVASILVLLASDFLGFRVAGEFSLIPMLFGVAAVTLGRRRTGLLWFPIAFLIFMVPIPASLTQSVALKLKLLATQCAVALANWCTLPMVRDGSFIHFNNDKLQVGEVCGGLRSLIALLAFGALMAYISKTKPWARAALLLMSGPVAVITNVLRIFALCIVGYFWGSDVAAGKFHDISGMMIFVVAFIMFFAIETQLRRWAPAASTGEGRE
ncbi:MAG: exosortase/archaeosortase family protein [Candidatus Hydrogenedentes bacterium]|nr:exosortase/archaeosortase family protein [Candidatus Hydrogenedentota bacterium]